MSASDDELLRIYEQLAAKDEEVARLSGEIDLQREASLGAENELRAKLQQAETEVKLANQSSSQLRSRCVQLEAELDRARWVGAGGKRTAEEAELPSAQRRCGPASGVTPGELSDASGAASDGLSHAQLTRELALARAQISDFLVTGVINESLRSENARLRSDLEAMHKHKIENERLEATIAQLKRAAAAWEAFCTDRRTSPMDLAYRAAEAEKRLEFYKDKAQQHSKAAQWFRRGNQALQASEKECQALRQRVAELDNQNEMLKIKAETLQAASENAQGDFAALTAKVNGWVPTNFEPLSPSQEPFTPPELLKLAQDLLETKTQLKDVEHRLALSLQALKAAQPPIEIREVQKWDPEQYKQVQHAAAIELENKALLKDADEWEDDSPGRVLLLQTVASLHARLDDAEAKQSQVSAKRAQEVRDVKAASSAVLGWAVESLENQVCVRSTTSSDLVYMLEKGNNSKLLARSQAFQQEFELWVTQRNALPEFFAAVLLAQWERTQGV